MKELTKEERHSIYVEALAFYKRRIFNGINFGFCGAIMYAAAKQFGFSDYPDPYNEMVFYPEIWKYRPAVVDGYWFNQYTEGIKKRIDILEEAIKLTE
jgi:hypothetical protein